MGGDEEAMMWLVANYGPQAVTMWVTDGFTKYKSGVYYESDCPNETPNHAVVMVGYGTDNELGDYWIIRNSWGTKWGENGK